MYVLIDFKITVIIKSEIVVFLHPVEELLSMQVLPLRLSSKSDRSGVQSVELDHFLFLLFGARVLSVFLFRASVFSFLLFFDDFYYFFRDIRSRIFRIFNRTFSRFFIFFLDYLYNVVNL